MGHTVLLGLAGIGKLVRRLFPEVRQLSTAELSNWLGDPSRKQPVLLDIRTEKEYAAGHLPGARHVDRHSTAAHVVEQLPAGRAVVAYCVTGYRSSRMARKLLKAGLIDVYNLEGSIAAWTAEGRPLEKDSNIVAESEIPGA